jgi:VWFA-related protein
MHRRISIRFFLGCIFAFTLPLLLANSLSGQAAADKEAPPSTAVVSNVDEVSIDFIARDKKKRPVLDLKPEDVAVTDDGSAVKLKDFRLVTGQTSGNHLISFVFDPLGASSANNARDIARKIMKLMPAEGFSFSVFKVEGRLRLLEEFTADREKVQSAIDIATSEDNTTRQQAADAAEKKLISSVQSGAGATAQTSSSDRSVEQGLLASLTECPRIMQDEHTIPPLAGLMALVRSQTAIRGRKLLIYFTNGMLPQTEIRDMVRSISDAANRAEVSVYVINQAAVDTKVMDGLMESAAIGNLSSFSHSNLSGPISPLAAGTAAQTPTVFSGGLVSQVSSQMSRMEEEGLANNPDPLARIAVGTGGAYLYSEDSLKKPFRRAVADLTTYYEASYVPPALEYNGKFRPVTVKTQRSGLKVQSRAGYFAVPMTGEVRPFEAPLIKLLSEPQLPQDLNFRSTVLQLGNLTTGNENTVVVEVPISGLDTRSNPNANLVSWHVSIVSQVKDKSGAVVEHFSEDIPGHGALDGKEEAWPSSATLQRHFVLPPGKYTLETVVVDRNSGKIGGERVHFEVAGAPSGPFLSDVALVRRIDSSPEELDPFEPLRYQQGKVVPTLSGELAPGLKQVSFFFLVHADSDRSDPAMLEMQVLRNGELLAHVPLQLPTNLGQAFPYVASLKTSSLPPGDYEVRLSLGQGEKVAERERSFSIAGSELASAALGTPQPAEKEAMPDSGPGEGAITPVKRQPLVITSLPADLSPRPADDDLDRIITGARKHALNYSAKLPNFLCVEVTDRSVDPSGNGRWRRKDSFAELLRYADNHETRTTLEVNGRPGTVNREDMNEWPLSLGEFGNLLNLVFQPTSKAEFHWKETAALVDGRVQVFEYKVDRNNNSMLLSDSSRKIYSGFHGLAYIDSSTMGVRRVTMEADDLPANFSIHAASISVDYDYVTVGQHEYLMPVRGTIRLKRGRREADLNQIVFQDYRRYASQTRIIIPPAAPKK